MSRSRIHASALRRIVARLEREDGARISDVTASAIASELRAHPEDAKPIENIAQTDEPWPAWLQDTLDRLFIRRRRGRFWRKIMADIRAKLFN